MENNNMSNFLPFQNDSQSLSIGEFTIENQGKQVNLYGSMTLTLDKQSLDDAKTLHMVLTQAIEFMQKNNAVQADRQDTLAKQQANISEVKNPFA